MHRVVLNKNTVVQLANTLCNPPNNFEIIFVHISLLSSVMSSEISGGNLF